MTEKTYADHFPWIAGRKDDPEAKPLYKIIARCMSLNGDSIVMLHKSGCAYVENYYIRDLVKHDAIMAGMDAREANLLRWVVKSEMTNPLTA